MATTKLTVQRGGRDEKSVTIAAGAAEAQSDTMSLNIDYTNIRRGEALMMLKAIEIRIASAPTWPPV